MNHNVDKSLRHIELTLSKIEIHLQDVKQDLSEMKLKHKEIEVKVEDLDRFKSKVVGAATIVTAVVAFLASIGHDLIKKIMGWN